MTSAHQRVRPTERRPTQPSKSCRFLQSIAHAEDRLSTTSSRLSESGTQASSKNSYLEITTNFLTPPTSFLRLIPDVKDNPRTANPTALELETPDSSETSFLKLTSPRGYLKNSGRKATVKTISETRNFSPIEKLPIELQFMTLEQLPIRETRNTRLASRSWAAAGVEHRFRHHFIVRPNPGMSRINYLDDLSKLEAVSQNPHISKDLILIEFASSDMPMPHFLLFLLDQKQAMAGEQWSRSISGIDLPSHGTCERSILENMFQYFPRLNQIFVQSIVRPTKYADYNLPTFGGWVDD
ncbi:hypothetical protein NA56DRAFT_661587 [Hyaloscypha hepaticicola]|uniref:Uncharacterized protein n=1 Tax=Hyaloscypha hepaticicola TaxID=2082293 RepID=A0A2J6PWG7_9HELO|nr:hypothetical protein NA56DRAFT_661587 [Hyaloscypha hepaticicola]